MKCIRCGKISSVAVRSQSFCSDCFVRIIEKRVKKECRANNLIRYGNRIAIYDDGTYKSKILNLIVCDIIKGTPVSISFSKNPDSLSYDLILLPVSCDDEINRFLSSILRSDWDSSVDKGKKTKIIKPLIHLLDEEIIQYAKIKGVIVDADKRKGRYYEFLDMMEMCHPETKASLLKSAILMGELDYGRKNI